MRNVTFDRAMCEKRCTVHRWHIPREVSSKRFAYTMQNRGHLDRIQVPVARFWESTGGRGI